MAETSAKAPDPVTPTVESTLTELVRLIGKMDMRLDAIEKQVNKIDNIQKCISSLTGRVRVLEKDVIDVKQQNVEFEKSADAMNTFYEQMKGKCDKNSAEILLLKQQLTTADHHAKCTENVLMESLESQGSLFEKIEDLQVRSMKRNLIFHGISENTHEDTEENLRDFFNYQLRLNKFIELSNVHRFGKRINGRPRPIVAVFLYHKDLEMVIKSGRMLQGTQYGINEQFPSTVEDRRKLLYPVAKHYKRTGHRVKMVRDKLFINGQLYKVAQDHNDCEQKRESRSYSQVLQTPSGGRGSKRARAPSTPRSNDARYDTPSASRPRYSAPPPRDDYVFSVAPSTPGRPVEERRAIAGPSVRTAYDNAAHTSHVPRRTREDSVNVLKSAATNSDMERTFELVSKPTVVTDSYTYQITASDQVGKEHRIGNMDSSEMAKWLSVSPSTPGGDPTVEERMNAEVSTVGDHERPVGRETTQTGNTVDIGDPESVVAAPLSTSGEDSSPVEEKSTA